MAILSQNQGLYPDFTAQYSSNIEMLLQQMESRLRGKVAERGGFVGKMAAPVTQYGTVTMKAPKGRFSPLDHTQPNSIRPWLFPQPGELPQLIDSFDELQTIVDPKSAYTQAAAAATGRFWDDGGSAPTSPRCRRTRSRPPTSRWPRRSVPRQPLASPSPS
jgi:hypothetical protein